MEEYNTDINQLIDKIDLQPMVDGEIKIISANEHGDIFNLVTVTGDSTNEENRTVVFTSDETKLKDLFIYWLKELHVPGYSANSVLYKMVMCVDATYPSNLNVIRLSTIKDLHADFHNKNLVITTYRGNEIVMGFKFQYQLDQAYIAIDELMNNDL